MKARRDARKGTCFGYARSYVNMVLTLILEQAKNQEGWHWVQSDFDVDWDCDHTQWEVYWKMMCSVLGHHVGS